MWQMMYHDQILLTVSNRGMWDMSWYPMDDRRIVVKMVNNEAAAASSKFEPIQIPAQASLAGDKCQVHSSCSDYAEAGCSCEYYTDFEDKISGKVPSSWEAFHGNDEFEVAVSRTMDLLTTWTKPTMTLKLHVQRKWAYIVVTSGPPGPDPQPYSHNSILGGHHGVAGAALHLRIVCRLLFCVL